MAEPNMRADFKLPDEAPPIDICVLDVSDETGEQIYKTRFTNQVTMKSTTKEMELQGLQQLAVFIATSMDLKFANIGFLNSWLQERGIPAVSEDAGYLPRIDYTDDDGGSTDTSDIITHKHGR